MRSRLASVPGWSTVCGVLLCAPAAFAGPAPQAPDCNNDGINDSLQAPWGPISVPDEASIVVGNNALIDVLSNDSAAGGYYGGICLDGYACNGCVSGSCSSGDTIIIISNPQHGSSSMTQNAGGPNHGRLTFSFSSSSSYCGDYEYMLYRWQDTCGATSPPTRVRVRINCPSSDQVLRLDGNGWILVTDTGSGSSVDLNSPFTIECWVKPDASSNVEAIVSKWGDGGIADRSFAIERWNTNQIQFGVSGSGTTNQQDSAYHTFFSGTLQVGVWQHVACTYDGSARRTYLNGVLVGVKPATGAVHQGSTHLAIGAKLSNNNQGPGDVSEFFHGSIDRVRIYPTALRANQIQLYMNVRFLANASQPFQDPPPVCAWEFDGDAHDSLGNQDGTIVGSVSFSSSSTPPNVFFDCDANGLPDYYDIASSGGDVNLNGVLDRCEYIEYCSPGLAGVLACPCSNPPSSSGRGCNNSSNTGGGRLQASGIASLAIDTMVLSASALKPTALCTVWHGNVPVASGVQLGQGVRCSGGALKRLYNKTAVGGAITAPQGADPRISVRSAALGDPLAAGAHRYYFVTYRDPTVLGGCSSTLTFNGTQAVEAIWAP